MSNVPVASKVTRRLASGRHYLVHDRVLDRLPTGPLRHGVVERRLVLEGDDVPAEIVKVAGSKSDVPMITRSSSPPASSVADGSALGVADGVGSGLDVTAGVWTEVAVGESDVVQPTRATTSTTSATARPDRRGVIPALAPDANASQHCPTPLVTGPRRI